MHSHIIGLDKTTSIEKLGSAATPVVPIGEVCAPKSGSDVTWKSLPMRFFIQNGPLLEFLKMPIFDYEMYFIIKNGGRLRDRAMGRSYMPHVILSEK